MGGTYVYIYIDILSWGKSEETVIFSLQACFVITNS